MPRRTIVLDMTPSSDLQPIDAVGYASNESIREWEQRFGKSTETWFFGKAPSDLAQWTWHYFEQTDLVPGALLEIGSGEGRDAAFFAAHGFRVTAVEPTSAGIEKTQRLLEERGVSLEALHQVDARSFELPSECQVVFSNNCIQCLGPECLDYLGRLQAATAPGGFCCISAFTDEENDLCGRSDLYCFGRKELRERFDGWKVLFYSEDVLWREPSQAYRSFARIVCRRL